ncbi:MAG: hypothetical protein K2Y35_05800 [Burkholderiales bacterium]|nr:hypothetical protein [Burkholderiales bacterium]
MRSILAVLGQAVLYALFAAFVGFFSTRPQYRPLPDAHALVKLSVSHAGALKADCRRRTREELERLPPNMRVPAECPRERSPLVIELALDGRLLHAETAMPSGLARDGAATVYRRFVVPAGTHHIAVRLNDDGRVPGFTHQREADLTLVPGQVLVIDFDSERKEVVLL